MALELTRKLRRTSGQPEREMWKLLYVFRRQGFHFRRQVQIGSYYVDFVCRQPSIVIEVDGDTHGTELAQSNDAVRDNYLRGRGYRVLRFQNSDVISNPEGVHVVIANLLSDVTSPPTPDPSPPGGGDQRARGRKAL